MLSHLLRPPAHAIATATLTPRTWPRGRVPSDCPQAWPASPPHMAGLRTLSFVHGTCLGCRLHSQPPSPCAGTDLCVSLIDVSLPVSPSPKKRILRRGFTTKTKCTVQHFDSKYSHRQARSGIRHISPQNRAPPRLLHSGRSPCLASGNSRLRVCPCSFAFSRMAGTRRLLPDPISALSVITLP